MANALGSVAETSFRVSFWMAATLLIVLLAVGPGIRALAAEENKAKGTGSKASKPSTPAAKIEEEDDPPADADLEMDESFSALVVPPEMRGAVKTMDRMKFSQELRGLLAEGLAASSESQAAAKRHFDAAHRLVPDDPRAAYAYGIALLGERKLREALDQFRASAQQSKAPFLPSLQAVAWVSVLTNDLSKAVPALLELARKVEESKASWPTEDDRAHSAEWLGRMAGFLSGPGKSSGQAALVEKLEADLDGLFTRERKEAYEQGRRGVAGRHKALQALAARPPNEVAAELKQKRQELQAELAAANAEVKQLEDEIREIKTPHEKQVADLNREMRAASAKSKKASRDIPEASEAVAVLSVPQQYSQVRTTSRYRVPYTTMRNETAQERKARETQLASARQKLQLAQSALDQAKQEIGELKSQRDQAEADFRKATAEKRKLLPAARRKAQELAIRTREVERGAATPEKIKDRVTALESYVPLDAENEKSRLLATLKS